MVKYPTILNLPQADINRQLYEMIIKAESGDADAIHSLETIVANIESAIGTETTQGSILYRIKALENANNGG